MDAVEQRIAEHEARGEHYHRLNLAEHEARGEHYHRLNLAEREMVDLGEAAAEHVRAYADSIRTFRQVRSDAVTAATAVGIERELDWRLDVDVDELVRSIADEVLG